MRQGIPLLISALVLACGEPGAETSARSEQCRALLREGSTCAEWKTRDEALRDAHYNVFRSKSKVQAEYDRGAQECKRRNRDTWPAEKLREADLCQTLLRDLSLGLAR